MSRRKTRFASTTAIGLALSFLSLNAYAQTVLPSEEETVLDEILLLTAEQQLKQAPGVSAISETDLAKQPPANDLSEIIRKMPGVNLTGTSASGQRGNNRQIDIRGMGPENTLILIDGKPVLSRNSVRMGRAGERDSRGDSNWVPAELVERIEVLRGPAAARYGSGSSGGVVNIITKKPKELTGSVGFHLNSPQDSAEGGSVRSNFMIAGPAGERLTFRVYGNHNRTDGDDAGINLEAWRASDAYATAVYNLMYPAMGTGVSEESARATADLSMPAGREGVVNKDLGGLLTWQAAEGHEIDFETTFSRQGNLFAGDRQLGALTDLVSGLVGSETNVLYRRNVAVTHRGEYDFGDSISFLQWENTRNRRNLEGLAGATEGSINTEDQGTIILDNINAKSEWNLPLNLWNRDQVLTLGAELRAEYMEDPISIRQTIPDGADWGIPVAPGDRDTKSDQQTIGIYAENNIYWDDAWTITPSLRADYNTNFGSNISPALNASWQMNDDWSLKLGVARAFKAPNLFQLNPNYVYTTMGNGCPWVDGVQLSGPCYVLGNPDLEAETSVNKEIGIAYNSVSGLVAGLTWFHNDYKNRIQSGDIQNNPEASTNRLFRWENIPEAVVSGLEGNLNIPLGTAFNWSTNATYMIESENKSNGQPLSLVPEYTINTALDWYANDALTVTLSATHYGEIEAPTINATTGGVNANTQSRDPYTLVNLGVVYDITEKAVLKAGVTNLFDEQLFREGQTTSAGANTFNEPGRAFYLGLTANF